MPMHNWKNVAAGTYHDFHHDWISTIRSHLNAGLLPDGLFAMAEQIIGGPAPDVVTLQSWQAGSAAATSGNGGAIAVAEPAVAPKSTYILQSDGER